MKRSRTLESSQGSLRTFASAASSRRKSQGKRAQKYITPVGRSPMVKWGFPLRLYISHRYLDNVGITSTTGSLAVYKFICNGMFDPNSTGVGHQPQYFDNCKAIYDHYTVVKSSCKFTITPLASATPTVPCAFAAMVDDDTTGPTSSIAAYGESANSVYKVACPLFTDPIVFKLDWNARKYFGGDPLSNDNLQGTGTANPTETSVFSVAAVALNLGTASFNVTAEITYYAVWEELATQEEN